MVRELRFTTQHSKSISVFSFSFSFSFSLFVLKVSIPKFGSTILLVQGHAATCEVLLKYGANAKVGDDRQATPLHLACLQDNVEVTIFRIRTKD
jgi:hypothetical protein